MKYLVDVNLPYRFSLWRGELFIHQFDLGDDWPDEKIWEYAEKNNLTIITKDSDFSHRMMSQSPPPRVIHIKLGNVKLNMLFLSLSSIWEDVLSLSERYKLVNIFPDRIEGIG